MAPLTLRDRDALVTRDGLILRVLGYTHPPGGYICDPEYAPAGLFTSGDPRAYRTDGRRVYYKFYSDEGWRFIQGRLPRYMILHEPLRRRVIGVRNPDIAEVKRPGEALRSLLEGESGDELLEALRGVLEIVIESSSSSIGDFGVFGSLLHGFYHPKLSDLDLIVYGGEILKRIRELLQELYMDGESKLSNEFEDIKPVEGKRWLFKNISPEEFVWHQRRKMIYGIFHDQKIKRKIKVEFEPVKRYDEIKNEYSELKRIKREGWVKALLMVEGDSEAPYMPSVYYVETLEVMEGPKVDDITRLVSYIEEFRMQAWRGEVIYAEGNLERVETSRGSYRQITLTYGPRYYEQVIKLAD